MEFILRLLNASFAALFMVSSLKKLFLPSPKRWQQVILFCLLGFTFILPCWLGDENPILLFPFFMVGFLLCLSGGKLHRLVAGGMFYSLLISLNMVMDSVYRANWMLYASLFIKLGIWWLLAWGLKRMAPEGGIRLSKRLWTLLGSLTLAPLSATLSFSIWGYHSIGITQYESFRDVFRRLGFTVLPFVLISALALLFAAVVLTRHEALEHETQLAALREVYYSGLKQEQNQLRTLRHDLRNHIIALEGLAEQGNQSELTGYLHHLADSPALTGGRRYAENEIANVVLSSKAAQMETLGLIPDFAVRLPSTLSLPAPELCALLGNALDNAIEGTNLSRNPSVILRARVEKGMFMLQVQNAIGCEINKDLSTTKQDASQHGYGLAGMREIAKRHGGSLETTIRDGSFELLICFPCK